MKSSMKVIKSRLSRPQMRRLLTIVMVMTLGISTVSCGGAALDSPTQSPGQTSSQQTAQPQADRVSDGQYPVQQVTYDDGSGEYSAVLLNTKPGDSSMFRAPNLPMAQLTDEEVKGGQRSYLKVAGGQPSLHLASDFKIEYVHNVTETQADPQTGQQQTVVVRQEPSFWTPFAGALAGQAIGSLLFTPRYYLPPVYQPGIALVGYGGYGNTYSQAVDRYQTRYRTPPAEVRNRQVFRTSGGLRRNTPGGSSFGQPTTRRTPAIGNSRDRSTGSGYGSSTLRRSNRPTAPRVNRSNRGFGSGRSRSGGRRR